MEEDLVTKLSQQDEDHKCQLGWMDAGLQPMG